MPKDLTRINSSLLRFEGRSEHSMLTAKTHFEQVPLGIVKKIIEEQEKQEKSELAPQIKAPKGRRKKFWQQP